MAAIHLPPTSAPPWHIMPSLSTVLHRGTHEFIIDGYSLHTRVGVGSFLRSGTFMVGGHSWAILCYPAGSGEEEEGYLSLFLELLSTTSEKITVEYIFEIDGPAGFSSPFGPSYVSTDFTAGTNARGYRKFIDIESLQSHYLWNDSLTVFCAVEVHSKEPNTGATTSSLITVPPSGICQDLAQLLESKQGADVTFKVGEKDYHAHKAVAAMRSPVFRAQFFGPLAEKPGRYVRIHDITPAAFEAVLHFIYTDTLPPVKDDVDSACSGTKQSHREMMWDRLAAADRYGLERMRLMCERALSDTIDVENAADTLELADRHHRPQLKAFCLDYIASPGVITAVMATDGYRGLKVNCPSLLVDVLEKLGGNR